MGCAPLQVEGRGVQLLGGEREEGASYTDVSGNGFLAEGAQPARKGIHIQVNMGLLDGRV